MNPIERHALSPVSRKGIRNQAVPVALTIASSDSGGGAGIQADLKTFAALGVHGTSAIVAITAQNTHSVDAIEELSLGIIKKQIEAVAQDMSIGAAKTGMLYAPEVITNISKLVRRYGFPLVVDPVMISKSGSVLLKDEAIDVLINELLPLATLVTPNVPEAERIAGYRITSLEKAKEAAKMIANNTGVKAVLVKGGHLEGPESVDSLYYEGRWDMYSSRRVISKMTHGTGCTFSAAITAELAKGADIRSAVQLAKRFVSQAIEYAFPLGSGYGPINPSSWVIIPSEKQAIMESLIEGVRMLESNTATAYLIPEVQTDIVMALPAPYCRSTKDIAGIPGRIVRIEGRVKASSPPMFGASSHMARVVLKVMEYDTNMRAAANIRYTEPLIKIAKELGYVAVFYDRRKEPKELKEIEGATLPWVVESAIKSLGRVPDLVYDRGDIGKEAMIRVLGTDAVDVAGKILKIASRVELNEKI